MSGRIQREKYYLLVKVTPALVKVVDQGESQKAIRNNGNTVRDFNAKLLIIGEFIAQPVEETRSHLYKHIVTKVYPLRLYSSMMWQFSFQMSAKMNSDWRIDWSG